MRGKRGGGREMRERESEGKKESSGGRPSLKKRVSVAASRKLSVPDGGH